MSERKIMPCLWFNFNAEEAVGHYLAVFAGGKVLSTSRYGDSGPGPKGAVMTMLFEIEGQRFLALNGGPHYAFTPAISLIVDCATQAEVDRLWDGLGEGGQPMRCGWITDKFGVSWQIVPSAVARIMQSGDAAGTARAMRAMMPMTKIDVETLEKAFEGP